MSRGSAHPAFVVHVLEPDQGELGDLATWPTRILHCVDVRIAAGWITCVVSNSDGSMLKATFPTDLVVEVDELIAAREVRAARKRLRQRAKEPETGPTNRKPRDPAYR